MSERELTPDQAEEVRRLLAEARHTEAMPEEVVARVDETLAALSQERASAHPTSPASSEAPASPVSPAGEVGQKPAASDELAARRRRRRFSTGLLAAAAVTVVGFAVPNMVQDGLSLGGSDDGAASTAQDGAEELGSGSEAPPEAQPDEAARGNADDQGADDSRAEQFAVPPGDAGDGSSARLGVVPVLREVAFGDDVAGLVAQDRAAPRGGNASALPEGWCAVRGSWGVGRAYPARYTLASGVEVRSVLLVRPAAESDRDGRAADLFACGEDEPTRSTFILAQ